MDQDQQRDPAEERYAAALRYEDCEHDSKRLVEGGYERHWSWREPDELDDPEQLPVAVFHGLEDFTDDGDGNYRLECAVCLAVFDLPDDWHWD